MLLFDHVKNNQGKCCQLEFSIPAKSQCTSGARCEGAQRLISVQSAMQRPLLLVINVRVDLQNQETSPTAIAVLHITTQRKANQKLCNMCEHGLQPRAPFQKGKDCSYHIFLLTPPKGSGNICQNSFP